MHALTFADHLLLLDELLDFMPGQVQHTDPQLCAELRGWVDRVPSTRTFAGAIRRHVRELCGVLEGGSESEELQGLARRGLRYLLESGGPEPEQLGELAAQAHAFVLSLVLHRVRAMRGGTRPVVREELKKHDRSRAEELFASFQSAPVGDDAVIIERTRALYDQSAEMTGTVFFRQLMRNAEFLVSVLESERAGHEAQTFARAALSYLVVVDDAIDDRLGLVGYLDDAYILETAVGLIDPARRPWMRLLDAASTVRALEVSLGMVTEEGERSVPGDVLLNAALLSEPFTGTDEPLANALFVPTAGSTTVLLGAAAALVLLRDASTANELRGPEAELRGWAERARELAGDLLPSVVIVAPPERAAHLIQAVRLGGAPLGELLEVARWNGVGEVGSWLDAREQSPQLVLVPDVEAASRLTRRLEVPFVLVDLEVATRSGLAEPPERPEPEPRAARPRRKRSRRYEGYDLLGGARDIPLLSAKEENELSRDISRARERLRAAVVDLGPLITTPLLDRIHQRESKVAPVRVKLADFEEALAGEDPAAAEVPRTEAIIALAALEPDDVLIDSVVREHAGDLARARRSDALEDRRMTEAHRRYQAALDDLNAAIRQITEANLRLVVSMARKYRPRGVPFFDLVQEGNLGLIRAARKFDHTVGARFATYARWWIRQGVEQCMAEYGRTIRIPGHALSTMRRVERITHGLVADLGREPTLEEVAEAAHLDPEDVVKARRRRHDLDTSTSLDRPLGDDSDVSIKDVITDPEQLLPDDQVAAVELFAETEKLMETLDPMETEVLRRRFGLGEHNPHTLAAIGKVVGLTRERIRQIELKALGKLRFRAKRVGVQYRY